MLLLKWIFKEKPIEFRFAIDIEIIVILNFFTILRKNEILSLYFK